MMKFFQRFREEWFPRRRTFAEMMQIAASVDQRMLEDYEQMVRTVVAKGHDEAEIRRQFPPPRSTLSVSPNILLGCRK